MYAYVGKHRKAWVQSYSYVHHSHYRFILASIYTAFSTLHSVINIVALLIGVVPKLPMLHGFRLFGINKY